MDTNIRTTTKYTNYTKGLEIAILTTRSSSSRFWGADAVFRAADPLSGGQAAATVHAGLDGRSAAFRWLRPLPKNCVPQAVTRLMQRYPQQIPQALTTAFNGLGLRYWQRRGIRSRSE